MSHLESITRSALTLTRQVLRPPLATLDERVVLPRLGSRSPVHQALAATVGLLDAVAPERAPSEEKATSDQNATSEEEATSEESASFEERMPADERVAVAHLTDELLDDQRDERFTGELADEELRRVQAQVRAKQLIEDPEHP